ncbi:MAG: HEAT repeat domain-containing protein [bacterium]|nr:HEAT repeat domain-containing protein [bacterium]
MWYEVCLYRTSGGGIVIVNSKTLVVISSLLVMALIGLGTIQLTIQTSVREICALAQQAHPHPNSNLDALLDYLNTPTHPLELRNRAVWATGRLKQPAALTALVPLHTGAACDHDNSLCQYEIAKAIALCGGNPLPMVESCPNNRN